MSTITRRAVVRSGLTDKGHRDHFSMTGVERGNCMGHPGNAKTKRVIQGRMLTPVGAALIFSHPTKKRTKGRMCWFVVGATV